MCIYFIRMTVIFAMLGAAVYQFSVVQKFFTGETSFIIISLSAHYFYFNYLRPDLWMFLNPWTPFIVKFKNEFWADAVLPK